MRRVGGRRRSRGHPVGSEDAYQALDVEQDHQPGLRSGDAAGQDGPALRHVGQVRGDDRLRHAHDLADAVEEKRVELTAALDHHVGRLCGIGAGQIEQAAHVDDGDDVAAQVEQPRDLGTRQGHTGQRLRAQHVADREDGQPEGVARDEGGRVLHRRLAGLVAAKGGLGGPGVARALPAFWTGWAFGFGYFVAGLWWIGKAFLVEAEEFAFLLPLAVAGFPALLGIFHGLAAVVARALSRDGWTRVVALAFALSGAEWLRGHVLTGFPWNAFGYAVMPDGFALAPAAWWGLYGVTFLTVLVCAAPALILRPTKGDRVAFGAILVLGLGATVGPALVAEPAPGPSEHRIRLVQPAVDQREKWAPGKAGEMFSRHVNLSKVEPLEGLTYVIWPESAFAFLIQREPNALAAIADLLPEGVRLVTGGMRGEDFTDGVPDKVWNSVLVIDDEGAIVESGDKTHLVPFGEYLPFAPVLRAIGTAAVGFAGRVHGGAGAAGDAGGRTFVPAARVLRGHLFRRGKW